MKKNNNGITMVSLIITIVVMFIIAGTTVSTSLKRFQINELNKMYNDIKLLSDKVANYYLKYEGLPIVRDSSNNPIMYPVASLNFDKNANDDNNYYILDLKAMDGLTLNYGKEGVNNPSASVKDIYIVNKASHVIYYVQGIEAEGTVYHTLPNDEDTIADNIPPTKPEIRVVEGTLLKKGDNTEYQYFYGPVTLELIPGVNKLSSANSSKYSINGIEKGEISKLPNHLLKIESGINDITLNTYKDENLFSTATYKLAIMNIGDYVEYDEGTGYSYPIDYTLNGGADSSKNQTLYTENLAWRVLGLKENGQLELISDNPTSTENSVFLRGQNGFLNAEKILNDSCDALYGKGEFAVGARSLNVEDINKLGNYDPAQNNGYGVEWWYRFPTQEEADQVSGTANTTRYMQCSIDKGVTWNDITTDFYQNFTFPGEKTINKNNTDTVKIVNNCYTYAFWPYTGRDIAAILTTESNPPQWLASLQKSCKNYGGTYFYVESLQNDTINPAGMWLSAGIEYEGTQHVRPVVTLSSDVSFTRAADGTWGLKRELSNITQINKGDFIQYNIEYTDAMYTSSNYLYTSTNGWRLLDYTDNNDGTYSNVKIISTGIPAMFNYSYGATIANNSWWITDSTVLGNFREILGGNAYPLNTNTENFYALQASAGLYYNLKDINFSYGTSSANKGGFVRITVNGVTYDNTNTEGTGEELFNLYKNSASIRLLTMAEVNSATKGEDKINNINAINESEDIYKIYMLSQLKNIPGMESYVYTNSADGAWWVASPQSGTSNLNNIRYINPNGTIAQNANSGLRRGIRPVICFSSNNIRFVDNDNNGICEINF